MFALFILFVFERLLHLAAWCCLRRPFDLGLQFRRRRLQLKEVVFDCRVIVEQAWVCGRVFNSTSELLSSLPLGCVQSLHLRVLSLSLRELLGCLLVAEELPKCLQISIDVFVEVTGLASAIVLH